MKQTALSSKIKGMAFLILAAFCFACMGACVRLAGDLPTAEKALFRNIIALAAAAGIMVKDRIPLTVSAKSVKFVILRAVCGTVGLICNFYALDRINLADASMLSKMSPFFAVLFSSFMLHEKIKPAQIGIVIAAFFGSLFIVKPTGQNMALGATLIAAAGGVLAGAAYTAMRGATTSGAPKALVIFVFSVVSTAVLLPLTLLHFAMPTGRQIRILLLCGAFSAGGQFAVTAGYTYAPAREISVCDYSQILFSAVLGIFLFDQVLDKWSLLGDGILISLAIINFVYVSRQSLAED